MTAAPRSRRPTGARNRELCLRWQAGDRRAGDALCEENACLIRALARRHPCAGLAFEDLVQEASLGLLHAARRYDPTRGEFSTIAVVWMEQHIRRAIRSKARMIRLPEHIALHAGQVHRCREAWLLRTGREPAVEEIARETRLSAWRVTTLLTVPADALSIDVLVGDDEDTPVSDCMEHDGAAVAEVFDRRETRARLEALLSRLDERDAAVMRARYFEQLTLQEVGDRIGCSREGVRQIEARSLRRLRAWMLEEGA